MFWPEQIESSDDRSFKIENPKSKIVRILPNVLAQADRVIK
jgi:hypothetical protein